MSSRQELLEFLHQSLMSGSTGCLCVNAPELTGKLYLKHGHLIHAECPSFLGEEGLWAILKANPDELSFEPNECPDRETITRPTELILMESAVHIVDEQEGKKAASASPLFESPMFQTSTSVQVSNREEENPRKMFILSQGKTILGRSQRCDLVVSDNTISRQHLEIQREGRLVRIVDLGGRNGTRINDRQVNEADLVSNDVITIGMVTLRFYWTQNGEAVLVQDPLMSPVKSSTGRIQSHPPKPGPGVAAP